MIRRARLGGFRVYASAIDIARFRRTWPCSGLPTNRGITADFASNGDLVRVRPDLRDADGLSALLDVMRDFGLARHGVSC